ncbi:MAG: FmdB family transcriptional regulator [SAR202 cluster bacterium]|nr:FmdB family transcriptional regulator [SAR202 cluster bacterium]
MPTYDYECSNKHRFEMRQSFSAEPVATCPTCGKKAKRMISAVPVVFKGSGWYVNDHGKKGGATGPTSSKDSASDGGGGAKSDTASDSAPKPTTKTTESSKTSEPAKASSTSSSSSASKSKPAAG